VANSVAICKDRAGAMKSESMSFRSSPSLLKLRQGRTCWLIGWITVEIVGIFACQAIRGSRIREGIQVVAIAILELIKSVIFHEQFRH